MTKQISLSEVKPGDRVTILIPNGIGRDGQEWKEKTGTAVIVHPSGNHVVLNLGGRYGVPGVATDRNFVRVTRKQNGFPKGD